MGNNADIGKVFNLTISDKAVANALEGHRTDSDAHHELFVAKQPTLTGQPGQAVGFGADGSAMAVPGWSNPNLLDNADFRLPVNRNGQTEYTVAGYTIDRWWLRNTTLRVNVADEGLKLTVRTVNDNRFFNQRLDDLRLLGKTVTISALLDQVNLSGSGIMMVLCGADNVGLNTAPLITTEHSNQNGLITATATLPESISQSGLNVGFRIAVDALVDDFLLIKAAKLELGPVQTLARQDADGNWVLNDPPDYDRQYALCSLYSPITGEWVGSQHSNPNLLDNWYFPDPINQRGETAYRGNAYGIDRWRIANDSTLMTVADDCMRLSTALTGSGRSMRQAVENPDALYGKPVTFSCLARSINSEEGLYIAIFMSSAVNGTNKVVAKSDVYYSVDDDTMISCTTTIPWPEDADNNRNITLYIGYENNKTTLNVNTADLIAAKLELGSVQTLARQDADGSWVLSDPPPNKAVELAKCQRYQTNLVPKYRTNYQVIGTGFAISTTQAKIYVPLPVSPRGNGTLIHRGNIALQKAGNVDASQFIPITSMAVENTGVNMAVLAVISTGLEKGASYALWIGANHADGNMVLLDFNL